MYAIRSYYVKEGLEAAGFVNFGFAAGGFAIVMSNTPVKGLDDLKGKRVWVPESYNFV